MACKFCISIKDDYKGESMMMKDGREENDNHFWGSNISIVETKMSTFY